MNSTTPQPSNPLQKDQQENRPNYPKKIACLLVFALGLLYAAQFIRGGRAIDFYHFWIVPQAVETLHQNDIYTSQGQQVIGRHFLKQAEQSNNKRHRSAALQTNDLYQSSIQPTATPFFFAMQRWLVTGDFQWDYIVFQILQTSLFIVGMLLLAGCVALPWYWTLAGIGVMFLFHCGLQSDIDVGNINRIQLFLLAVVTWVACRRGTLLFQFTAGLLLGLTIAYKPNLAFVAPLMLATCWFDGQRKRAVWQFAGVLGGCITAVLVGSYYFGSLLCWQVWQQQMSSIWQTPYPLASGNYSLARLILQSTSYDLSAPLVLILLIGSVGLLWFSRQQKSENGLQISHAARVRRTLLPIGLGSALPLIAAPLTWIHYSVLAFPLFIYLLRPCDQPAVNNRQNTRRCMALVALVLSCLTPAAWLGIETAWQQTLVVQSGLLLALALVTKEMISCRVAPFGVSALSVSCSR